MEHDYIQGDLPQPAGSSLHWQQHTPVPLPPSQLLGPSAIQQALAQKVADLERTNTELRARMTELEGQVAELLAKE